MAKTSPEPAAGFLRLERFYLGAACFTSGAALMVIELSAARLLAPMFGNSIYTWTALIGVILVAFSVGGYAGGRLADRRAGPEVLGWLLAAAALLTFLIPGLAVLLGPMLSDRGLVQGPVLFALLLLALPGALLGAVSPASVRLYSLTWRDSHVGGAAGTVSMLGSLGSFVGTFLSGFVLLGAFGVRAIFLGCAALLLLLALAAFALARGSRKRQAVLLVAGGVAAAAASLALETPTEPGVLHERESFYHHIKVTEQGEGRQNRRYLQLDSTSEGGIQTADGALVLEYQHYWRLAVMGGEPLRRALFIGAGAFGMPCEVSREFPEAEVDVAELDPQVIDIGRQYFHLDKHPRVQAHAGDARHYLRTQADRRWDLIFGDAYNGVHAIPPHLATREFFQLVADRLEPGGVYLMNTISAVQGPRAELLAGMLATLREVFAHVEIFAVQGPRQLVQNVVIMASQEDRMSRLAGRRHIAGSVPARIAAAHVPRSQVPADGQVFTDDFNPVDAIIARAMLR